MEIDLNFNDVLNIDEKVHIPKNYYENSDIKGISDVKITGSFFYDSNTDLCANVNIVGELLLLDDISLEEENYPFSIKYSEKVEKNLINRENKLDLFEFLWENIVLEVPLKFTKVTNLSEFHGNGWKLVSEDDNITSSNPFNDLLKNFDKEE